MFISLLPHRLRHFITFPIQGGRKIKIHSKLFQSTVCIYVSNMLNSVELSIKLCKVFYYSFATSALMLDEVWFKNLVFDQTCHVVCC
ncbi:CLUMA_CG004899, isoform A [Clunio marinus]|uniref:CLUMA_CG004899, isoform A n=1 Tax=Clunio marinus TaxID=568069 RepID=A0A1J1HT23_9DIPT|nr:CLUMA_CG004899, isoform A [Clunio marinus]